MKSQTLPSFWDSYQILSENNKRSARKAYRLWKENPFHPSLRFKCINSEEDIWSVRINRSYRAIGILDSDTVLYYHLLHPKHQVASQMIIILICDRTCNCLTKLLSIAIKMMS